MSEPADMDFSNMENQFYEDCEALRKSEISEERITALWNLWESFHDSYKSNSLRDADRCLECLLICTAQLVFNVNYSKKISSDSKKKLKGSIISCGNSMQDCVHRQKLLTGIGSIIENPWQAASFNNTVSGPKSKKEDASNKLWETEGWVMLESRIDYLSKIGIKCIDRVCSVLHVLVEKGHEMFRKNGNKSIPFHPYEFPYRKYIEYLEVYALLRFNNLLTTQIVDTWEPPVLLEVVASLVKKAGDPNSPRLFPKLKQWKDAGEAGTFFAKKATWRALKLPNATLLKEFFSIWMEMSGFVDSGAEQSDTESPIDEIIKEEITCTENLYQIADVTIKLMGETSFTRLKYVELFVLAMTKDMTVIEALKRTQPDLEATIKEHEERLSIRYLDLTRFFKDFPKTAKDCLITAFSLYPCQKLFTFLFPSSLSETENIDITISEEGRTIPAEYDDIKEMGLEHCDLKVEEELDLGDGASDDLATLIHNPRYKGFLTLNSNEELKKVCLKLLDSKSVAFIENRTLDFVKVDYAKYKDLKSRYDPEDDGIEQGYRQGDKRNRRALLQLAKRNVITMKRAKKIAIQRARKHPGDGSEGVRRKGRPPKATLLGDAYHSNTPNNRKPREDISRTIPNVSLSLNPWFPQSGKGGFYTEFFHTCIRVIDPPYKERSYGRNFNHEAELLKSVKQDLIQNRPSENGSVAHGNSMQQNASTGNGIGSQSQNSETTFGDIGNNHSNILNSSDQPSNETITQTSNEPNGNPFFEDPFSGPLRNLVYQYTLENVPAFAERGQASERNLLGTQESNEQVPQVVRNHKKRRNISTVTEESVTVKKSRRGPPRRSIHVQSLSDADEPHENPSSSNRDNDNDKTVLEGSNLESSSNEPGAVAKPSNEEAFITELTSREPEAITELPLREPEVITELVPNAETEPIPVTPERESVFAGPFQIMTTKKTPAVTVSPKVAVPETENVPIVKESSTNLTNSNPSEIRLIQKPMRTYGNTKNGKRRLVITRPLWQNSDDKQLEAYKSAIPVVKADLSQISSKLNLPGTSGQTTDSPSNGSGSIITQSADIHLGPGGSSYSEKGSRATTSQEISKPQSVESSTNIVTLTGHDNNEKILEEGLSRSNNEDIGGIASSVVEMPVCDSEPSVDGIQKGSNKNTQLSSSVKNVSSNTKDNSETSEKCLAERDIIDVTKNEKIIEVVTEIQGEASTKPLSSNTQNQNDVPNKDPIKATLNLIESKSFTTSKESNSISTTTRKAEIQFSPFQMSQIKSLLSKNFSVAPSSPTLTRPDSNPLSKSSSTKLVNSEVNPESTENHELETTVTVTSPEIAPPSSHSLVSNDHDVSSILSSSNDSATVTSPFALSSPISSIQASDDQPEKPGLSSSVSPTKDNSPSKQSNIQPDCAEDSGQICLSTNDQMVPANNQPEVSDITPLTENSSPAVVPNDLCMVCAKDVICQLLDMVVQKENENTSTTENSLQKDSAPGESNTDLSLEKEGVQAQMVVTGTGIDCSEKSQVEPSTSDQQTTTKLNESNVDTSSIIAPSTDESSETKCQETISESQVTPEKSRPADPEIICLDSEGEDDGMEKDFAQDITAESDDDVECNSEIAQLNSRLLPHDALPGEENQNCEGNNRVTSEIPRPLTPVEIVEKIINDKFRPKAKRPYDEEEDRIKVANSVVNYAKHTKIRLRSLVACCVILENLPMEKLSERDRNQLEACNHVKRSSRLKKKRKRIVDCLKNIWEKPNTEQEMESESSESDSDIEILEIKEIKEPKKTLPLSMRPKIPMPQCRKRKFNNSPKQHPAQGSKILKICSNPSNSNDSGVSGGNASDPEFELPSGSSTEVEDEEFEPGANSTCQNFPLEVYPNINCNPLSPDEVFVDDQVDPLAINDSDGRTYDQGVTRMITDPESVVGLQVAVDESMSNLQPDFPKSQNGIDKVNSLLEETKEGEDSDYQDVAKENFTQESSDSDCEIIEDGDSSDSVGKTTQILHRQETRRTISSSLPPSATNTNLEKRLTRSSELINSRSTRLTTDKSLLYQCSSLSLDENSIPDVNANTEDTDNIILSTESSKEEESAEIITSDVIQNMEDDETITGTDSLYILPDENMEDSCSNEENGESNSGSGMEVNILQCTSTDYPATSETILSDNDQFVDKMTDQQINHVTYDLENDTPINSPQIATIPEQEICEARDIDPSLQEGPVPVVNQSVEEANEENHCNISSEDDDVVVLDMDMTANNDTSSPPNAMIPSQDTSEQISRLPSDQENVSEAEVSLSVEEVNEGCIDPVASDDEVVILEMEASTSVDSPPNETIPEQDACEQLSLPFQQIEPVVDLNAEEENEEDIGLSSSEKDLIMPDMTTASESTIVDSDQCEPERDECPPSTDKSASADVIRYTFETLDQISHEVITDFDSSDKHGQYDNDSPHQNIMEAADSESQSVVLSDNVTHPYAHKNDNENKKQEENIDADIEDINAPSIIDTEAADSVLTQHQPIPSSNKEDESVDMNIFEIVDEDVDESEEEKEDTFSVEEELSTSSEEYFEALSDVCGTTNTAGNEITDEFSKNWPLKKVTSAPHVVDEIQAESKEGDSPPPVFILEGESVDQEKETAQKSPQAEVDLDEDGMRTQEDTIPEVINIPVDKTVFVADTEHVDSPLTSSHNDYDDQDQEWVSSMHMDIEEPEPGSPKMPVLTREVEEFSENYWDSNDKAPEIDYFGNVPQFNS